MAAIGIGGVIGYEVREGAFNGDLFKEFVASTLIPYFSSRPDLILIMDNCKFHHRQDVLALLNQGGITYKFLPPYSPMLNPIEEVFGTMKAKYKNIRPLSKKKEDVIGRVLSIMNSFEGGFLN